MWLGVTNSFAEPLHFIVVPVAVTAIAVCTCFQEQKAWSALKNETTKFRSSVLSSCFASCLFPVVHLLALTSLSSGFTLKLTLSILSTIFNFAALLIMCSVSCFPSALETLSQSAQIVFFFFLKMPVDISADTVCQWF